MDKPLSREVLDIAIRAICKSLTLEVIDRAIRAGLVRGEAGNTAIMDNSLRAGIAILAVEAVAKARARAIERGADRFILEGKTWHVKCAEFYCNELPVFLLRARRDTN
jgi:hypothetical protein